MFGAATRVLRLSFGRRDDNQAADVPGLEFVAYAADRLLVGSIQLDADRLTDLLNACDEVELVDITWLGFQGEIGETSSASITRRDLLVVKAGLPRGNPARRHGTRQVPVVAAIGPYVVYGYLHSRPGSDPMVDLGRRAPMVPLTDASICYERNGTLHREDAATFIVNRDQADSIRLARESDVPGERSGLAS